MVINAEYYVNLKDENEKNYILNCYNKNCNKKFARYEDLSKWLYTNAIKAYNHFIKKVAMSTRCKEIKDKYLIKK